QIPNPGDYFTLDLFGEPIVVARGSRHEVRTSSRICRHRAMSVVEGAGNRNSFQCPYHLRTYALDGKVLWQFHRWLLGRVFPEGETA
ncbi:MAG TPA: Rieske 2Fe-2S domain-containing protein, partial [Candidatus Binataceae bacterium]